MSSLLFGMDRISLRKIPHKPHEWPFKLQKWAFRAFKTRSLRGWDLKGSKLKGVCTSENPGNALRQDFALFRECENRVLIMYHRALQVCLRFQRAAKRGLDPSWLGFGFFWGAPIFHPEVPKPFKNWHLGTSGLKIRAPQKRQLQPRRIQPPICGPLKFNWVQWVCAKCPKIGLNVGKIGARQTLRAQILKKFKILKFSSELEIFKRATHQTPIFCGEFWRSGLKISSEIEIFKRD